jgi:TolB-like protein/Tfp pilus assembly protein PilF
MAADRLDSWKEIAAYLRRDERTVRRWERKEGLPVHRHQHHQRGSVYAYRSELDTWWQNGRPRLEPSEKLRPSVWRLGRWRMPSMMLLVLALAAYITFRPSKLAPPLAGEVTLAVLPFANLSGDPGQDYLCSGFTEEMITRLGRLSPGQLRVTARTATLKYKDNPPAISEIGRELGADYILEGSCAPRRPHPHHGPADRVHDQTYVWTQEYDRQLQDMLLLQSEVAEAIAREIQLELPLRPPSPALRAGPVHPGAYQLFLKGRYHLNRGTGGREKARQYFEQAIAKDPNHGPSYAGLAEAYTRLAIYGPLRTQEAWRKAETAARKALEIDDTLPDAHLLGIILLLRQWDWKGARSEFLRALALNPSDANAHSAYALYLRTQGRMEEAIAERKLALEADRLRVDLISRLGEEYIFARHYGEAIAQFQQALELEPNYTRALSGLADASERNGMRAEAAAARIRLLHLYGRREFADAFERLYRTKGYSAAARFWDEKQAEEYRQNADMNCWNLAFTYARLGDKEKALYWLEKAYEARDVGLTQIQVDPDVDSLRSEPRFQAIVRHLGPHVSPSGNAQPRASNTP